MCFWTENLDYFEPLFDQKKESIYVEYQDLKTYMSAYKSMPIYDVYIALIQTGVPSTKNIISLVELVLCLSCSTAKWEKIFSSFKLLKVERPSDK